MAMKVDNDSKPLRVVTRLSRDVVHQAILDKGVIYTDTNSTWLQHQIIYMQFSKSQIIFLSNLAKFWHQFAVGLADVILVALHRVFHLTMIIIKNFSSS